MATEHFKDGLRRKAEKLVSEGRDTGRDIPAAGRDTLIHELEVHQIELELQNEELQQAQRNLQASRNLYADLFEFAPVGYFMLDSYFLIAKANLAGSQILDMEDYRLIGKRFMSFVEPADQGALYRCFISQSGERGRGCETTMLRRDGSHLFAQLNVSEVSAETQGAKYRVAVVDITERRKMEDELNASRGELETLVQKRTIELSERSEQLRRMTGQLAIVEQQEKQRLAVILHDGLQQLLVGAKYRLALIERNSDLKSAKDAVLNLIDDAIETSRSLTAEISPPVLLQSNFVAALEWLTRWMRDKHGLSVNLRVHGKVRVLTNEETLMLFQCIRELLFNVVKHSGVKEASLELTPIAGGTLITVEDRGIGFDISQLCIKKDQMGGAGLLSIKERISYIGGRMEIHSAPSQGSRVMLVVPVFVLTGEADEPAKDKPRRTPSVVPPELVAETPCGAKKIHIMLVDDHVVVRQGLAGLLRNEPDFEIVGEASNGESAVNLARDTNPDVILMDISMQGMDGIQATAIIHGELPEIHIIGLSMFEEDDQKTAMREAGADAYYTKSGPSEELIKAIRTCA